MNRPASAASVLGSTATWRCVCLHPVALHGRSGSAGGPTPDTIVVCPGCQRAFFIIPQDKSHGPPIEVVELFALPAETSAPAPST